MTFPDEYCFCTSMGTSLAREVKRMGQSRRIDIHYLTRVEGHGNIHVEIRNGALAGIRFEVVKAPRFFEAFLQGRNYDEVTHIASRKRKTCYLSEKFEARNPKPCQIDTVQHPKQTKYR
jgi:hypothetical protein